MILIRKILFILALKPLILRNYKLRQQGLLNDEWYWFDLLATEWGFFVDVESNG